MSKQVCVWLPLGEPLVVQSGAQLLSMLPTFPGLSRQRLARGQRSSSKIIAALLLVAGVACACCSVRGILATSTCTSTWARLFRKQTPQLVPLKLKGRFQPCRHTNSAALTQAAFCPPCPHRSTHPGLVVTRLAEGIEVGCKLQLCILVLQSCCAPASVKLRTISLQSSADSESSHKTLLWVSYNGVLYFSSCSGCLQGGVAALPQ